LLPTKRSQVQDFKSPNCKHTLSAKLDFRTEALSPVYAVIYPRQASIAIVKTLVEKKADIVAVHKEAESFSLDNQVQTRSSVPFHPGALKHFKEKGVGGGRLRA
jgi:hypothetical protein